MPAITRPLRMGWRGRMHTACEGEVQRLCALLEESRNQGRRSHYYASDYAPFADDLAGEYAYGLRR
jgi:hypothetical protein